MKNLDNAYLHAVENDVGLAMIHLFGRYEQEVNKKGNVSPNTAKDNLDHTIRVLKNVRRIGQKIGCTRNTILRLEISAILHDGGKLDAKIPGGIDTFNHHQKGAKEAYYFLTNELNKSPRLAKKISKSIERHSFIPFIISQNDEMKEHKILYRPKSIDDKALFDADVLDMMGIHGFMKIVRIRQNENLPFFKEDGGDIKKAMASALKSALASQKILFFKPSQEIGRKKLENLQKLITEIEGKNITDLTSFNNFMSEKLPEGTEIELAKN